MNYAPKLPPPLLLVGRYQPVHWNWKGNRQSTCLLAALWNWRKRERRGMLENVQKAQEKSGKTRARAVSHGEVRHKLFLMKRQDRDLLRVMQRRHLKVS